MKKKKDSQTTPSDQEQKRSDPTAPLEGEDKFSYIVRMAASFTTPQCYSEEVKEQMRKEGRTDV